METNKVHSLLFPVSLVSEVPNDAYLEGIRAVWHSPGIADAAIPMPRPPFWRVPSFLRWLFVGGMVERGVVEVTDIRGNVLVDGYANTLTAARAWLESLDWAEVLEDEQDDLDKGDWLNDQRTGGL